MNMILRARLRLFASILPILIAFLGPVPSAAARAETEPEKGALTELSLEELMDIPVYAASRYVQDVSEAPASVTIITAREIKAYGWRTLADALNSVPGFYTSYDRSYHYVGMRGFSRPGDYNERVLILIDGVRTNENIYESSAIGNDFNIDLDLIERIEVVRGPGSVLYGTNAFFAVVNVITKTGHDFDGGEAAASAGSRDSYQGRLSFGHRVAADGEFLVSGSYYGSNGGNLYFPELDSPAMNGGIADGKDGEFFGNLFAEARWKGWGIGLFYADRTKPRATASYGSVFNDSRNEDIDKRLNADFSYEGTIRSALDFQAHLTFQDYVYDGNYAFDYAEDGEPPLITMNMDRIRGQWWGSEVRLSGSPLTRNRATVGAEYRDNFRLEQRNFDENMTALYLDSRRSSRVYGIYAQDELRLSAKMLLNAGVRYDYTSPLNEGDVSPRIAFIVKALPRTTVKLLYGEAFRSPNAWELYYNDGGNTTKDNPALDSESIRTFEAVLDHQVSSWLRGILSAYRYEIDNLISQRVDPSDGLLQYQNLDAAEANGLELSLVGKAPNGIEGRLSYAYSDARLSASHARLSNSPQSIASLNLITPPLGSRFRAAVETKYVGDRLTLAGRTADAYYVVNVNLLAADLLGTLEVSLGVFNLLDAHYGYPAGGEFLQDVLEADGRTARLKCTYGF